MKIFLALFVFPVLGLAQSKVESRVYRFGERVDGPTTLLQQLIIHHQSDNDSHEKHTDEEELIIVKEGQLKATVNGHTSILGPGSIAYIIPNDEHAFINSGNTLCSYYLIRYKVDKFVPSDKPYPSFTVDWSDMKFVPNDKGGRRGVVDHRTTLFERFEMHVTTLNPNLSSHDPHSHAPEEIILIKEGDVEENIGDEKIRASTGDLIFLDSKIFHNITNIGQAPATYFAFQWN